MEITKDYIVEYTKRAEETLAMYADYKHMVKKGNVDIPEVNKCLAEFFTVSKFLIAEYERKMTQYELVKADFDMWYADKFIDVRNKYNTNDLTKSKWLSKDEIKMNVMKENREEYQIKHKELLILEREVSTLRRLNDTYKKMDGIFQTLSYNQRADLKAYSLPNRMNNSNNQNNNYNNIRRQEA